MKVIQKQNLAEENLAQNRFRETADLTASSIGTKDASEVIPQPSTPIPEKPVSNPTTPTQPTTGSSYSDIAGNKEEYRPNSGVDSQGKPLVGGGSNTGSGAEAAVGTQYSWQKTGGDKAQKQYESDVIGVKQNMNQNRQTIENNAVNYQAQADMMKYQNNQAYIKHVFEFFKFYNQISIRT